MRGGIWNDFLVKALTSCFEKENFNLGAKSTLASYLCMLIREILRALLYVVGQCL